MRVLTYSLLRLLVFGVALGIGYLLGLRWWLLVLVAAVLAALTSYALLGRSRDAAAAELAERAARRGPRAPRVDLDAEAEDAAVDAVQASPDAAEPPAEQR